MNILEKLSNTKYSILYIKIIERAINENRKKLKKENSNYIYYEAHHILPKSLFPEYNSFRTYTWNKVLLTAREHFICHLLIWKHYKKLNNIPFERKMSKAIHRMNKNRQYNSKLYEHYKLNLKDSPETKLKKSLSRIGLKHSAETKQKISLSNKDKPLSEEHKKKLRKPKSEIGRLNMSIAAQNRDLHSVETKAKMKLSKKLRDDRNYRLIEIYNDSNVLQYSCNYNLEKFCSDNYLPYTAIYNSLKTEEKLYEKLTHKASITRITNLGYFKYKGWYALKV